MRASVTEAMWSKLGVGHRQYDEDFLVGTHQQFKDRAIGTGKAPPGFLIPRACAELTPVRGSFSFPQQAHNLRFEDRDVRCASVLAVDASISPDEECDR
jgi:hypothetical protein